MVQLMILLHSNVLITEYMKDLKSHELEDRPVASCRTVVVIIPQFYLGTITKIMYFIY